MKDLYITDLEIIKKHYNFNTINALFYIKSISFKKMRDIRKEFFKNKKRVFKGAKYD